MAPKPKQNRFHHKMVNNKKNLFLTREDPKDAIYV